MLRVPLMSRSVGPSAENVPSIRRGAGYGQIWQSALTTWKHFRVKMIKVAKLPSCVQQEFATKGG